MVGVMDVYEVTKTNHKMCMLIAWKNQDAVYVQLILEELKLSSPDFDRLYNNMFVIQRLTHGGNKGHKHEK